MTQALNLALLGNNTNSSGQVSLTTGVSGTLPAGNGGTGLSSPGASGNVLTSNGSAWVSSAPATAVTSVNGVSGAVVTTNFNAIGSCVVAGAPIFGFAEGTINPNYTVAGSSLRMSSALSAAVYPSSYNPGLTGSWRSVGQFSYSYTPCPLTATSNQTIWIRYA